MTTLSLSRIAPLLEMAIRQVKPGRLEEFDLSQLDYIDWLGGLKGVGDSGEYQ